MRKSLAICVTLFLVFIFYAHSSEASVVAFAPEQLQPIENVNNIYELIDRWTGEYLLIDRYRVGWCKEGRHHHGKVQALWSREKR